MRCAQDLRWGQILLNITSSHIQTTIVHRLISQFFFYYLLQFKWFEIDLFFSSVLMVFFSSPFPSPTVVRASVFGKSVFIYCISISCMSISMEIDHCPSQKVRKFCWPIGINFIPQMKLFSLSAVNAIQISNPLLNKIKNIKMHFVCCLFIWLEKD